MKKIWLAIAVLLLFGVYAMAEDVAWNQDSTAAGGRRQGVLVQTPTGEKLPTTDSGIASATAGDTSVNVRGTLSLSGSVDATLTDTKVTVESMPDVILADSGINDAGGSLTVDNSNLDTQLTLLLAQLVAINGKTTTPPLADVTLADTIIDLVLTDSGTVYNVALPAKTVAYEFWALGTGVVNFSMSSAGTSTSYMPLKSGYSYNTFGLGSEKLYTGTIYFRCPLANNETICVRIWTKP